MDKGAEPVQRAICQIPTLSNTWVEVVGKLGCVCKLSLLRKPHANQYRRLRDVMMRITHNSNGAWLHHHGERKVHWIFQPSLCEGTKDMAVSNLEIQLACRIVRCKAIQEKSFHTIKTSAATPPFMWGFWTSYII